MVFWFYFLRFLIDVLLGFYCRNEDLKQMLESSKDSAKLDAMKRIVGVCNFFNFYLLGYLFYYFLDVNTIFALQILYQVST